MQELHMPLITTFTYIQSCSLKTTGAWVPVIAMKILSINCLNVSLLLEPLENLSGNLVYAICLKWGDILECQMRYDSNCVSRQEFT